MQTVRNQNLIICWSLTGLAVAGILVGFDGTFRAMLEIWLTSSNFNHCILIAPLTAALIWRQRHSLAEIPPRSSVFAVCGFVVLAGVWMLGSVGNVLTISYFAVVAMISMSAWAVLGWPMVRAMAFPLAYLFFMVPFGEFLMPRLMEWTADITVLTVRASGVPVYRDGLFFTIPNGSFNIVEACSGVRMLIASVATGVVFAHVAFVSRVRWFGFVFAMIVAALLANGLRAYTVVMLGHYMGMDVIAHHNTLGYVIFAITIFGTLMVGIRFADVETFAYADVDRGPPRDPGPIWASALAAAVIIAVSFATPATVSRIKAADSVPSIPAPTLPEAGSDWSGPHLVPVDWSPQYIGQDSTQLGQYRGSAGVVDAFLLWYPRQDQGAELISGLNTMFNPKNWAQTAARRGRAELGDGRLLEYSELELRSHRFGKRLVRYWFVVDNTLMLRPWKIKLSELLNSIRGRPTPASLVAISTRLGDDRGSAAETLDAFVADFYSIVPAVPAD